VGLFCAHALLLYCRQYSLGSERLIYVLTVISSLFDLNSCLMAGAFLFRLNRIISDPLQRHNLISKYMMHLHATDLGIDHLYIHEEELQLDGFFKSILAFIAVICM
jgi:hypothetical protein